MAQQNEQTIILVFQKLWKNPKNYALQGRDANGQKFRATFFPDANGGALLNQVQNLQEGAKIRAGYVMSGQFRNLVSVEVLDEGKPVAGNSSNGAPSTGTGGPGAGAASGNSNYRTAAQQLKVSAMNIASMIVSQFLDHAPKTAVPKTLVEYLDMVGTAFKVVNPILQSKWPTLPADPGSAPTSGDAGSTPAPTPVKSLDDNSSSDSEDDIPF